MTLPFDIDNPTLALAAWSRICEPGDPDAHRLVKAAGPSAALRWLLEPAARAASSGAGVRQALRRWLPRLEGLDPRRELRVLHSLGGCLIAPGEPSWPVGLDDLGEAAPLCLWQWSPTGLNLAEWCQQSVAVVGSRACTHYGTTVAGTMVRQLVSAGLTVVSGGAFGIDAAAHRATLAAGGRTVAVMAGGLDRLYPAANEDMLRQVAATGAVISELPPGSAPRRERFLDRNRLMAAMTKATVVVESGWRSGAHRTAAVAAELLRPVAAVPGPVTAASSAGCHRLIREGAATLVTGADQVLELATNLGRTPETLTECQPGPLDGLSGPERRVFDALPLRGIAPVSQVVVASGLATAQVLGALSRLEQAGRAATTGGGWRRNLPTNSR